MTFLYNPETFSPEQILPDSLKKFGDDARYFIHKIYVSRVFNKRRKDGFVPLKADYLRRIMSYRKYPALRQALLDSGAIIADGCWIRGRKAIGYRLGPDFENVRHQRVRITNSRLIKNLKKEQGKEIKGPKLDVHKHLESWLHELEVNYDDALTRIQEDFYIHELSAAMIRDKQWYFVADKYGRVHTNVSNLKSSIRPALHYKGEPLVGIDIKNSQPFFLGVLLADMYSNKGSLSVSYNLLRTSPPHPLPLRCDILPPDVSQFLNLAAGGGLYEFIAAHSGCEITDRRTFKQKLFAEIFFCKNHPWETDYSKLFGQLFPNVYQSIKKLKEKDYTNLAKLLQRVESSAIINGVIRLCMEDHPSMPVFTIHDSFLTTAAWVDQLCGLICQEFTKIGIIPKLRIEN